MTRGAARFYYSKNLPRNSVAIAQISAASSAPSQLTDINNIPVSGAAGPGLYQAKGMTSGTTFSSTLLGQSVTISGDTSYLLQNQFFEITNFFLSGSPLYYQQILPADVTQVTVLNLDGTSNSNYLLQGNILRHSFDGSLKYVRYYSNRSMHSDIVQYNCPLNISSTNPTENSYSYLQGVLRVSATTNFSLRWKQVNGYQILRPYNVLANDPWYARIRFGANPSDPEWAQQNFTPFRPYQLATWVPGTLIAPRVIQFERQNIYWDGSQLPDILVYDQNYNLKYAIDGSPANTPPRRGYLYPWKRGQYASNGFDSVQGRVNLIIDIEPTDIVFGFYYYAENDLVYTDLDVNPFTNTYLKNKLVEYFYKPTSSNPFKTVYYRLYNSDGSADLTALGTNDPSPGSGAGTTFGHLVVGDSVSIGEYTISDVRERGGGLLPQYQSIPAAQNFWDVGYLDGKPYPLGGTMAIYLPTSLLKPVGLFTKLDIQEKVSSLVPVGTIPVIRYYDQNGIESV